MLGASIGQDAREPQNPTKSEEYQKRLQGALYSTYVRGTNVHNAVLPTLQTPRILRSELRVQRTGESEGV